MTHPASHEEVLIWNAAAHNVRIGELGVLLRPAESMWTVVTHDVSLLLAAGKVVIVETRTVEVPQHSEEEVPKKKKKPSSVEEEIVEQPVVEAPTVTDSVSVETEEVTENPIVPEESL